MRRRAVLRGLAAAPWFSGCGGGPAPLRFTGIPDGDKQALKEGYAAVANYLSAALKTPVEAMHVPDYTAAVTALASGGIDFAWLELEGGCHQTFALEVCSTLDPELGTTIVNAYALAFARARLLGDEAYASWLDGSEQPWTEATYQRRTP